MSIWIIEALDPDDDCWKGFSHTGPVKVRASDDQGARNVAEVKFGPKFGPPPGEFHGNSPWQNHSHSSCNRLKNSGYEEDGDDELLEPLGK